MMRADLPSPRANRILGALPLSEYLTLAPHLEAVQVQAGQALHGAGAGCTHAHFPVDCAVTLVSATRDGELSELALIGREGLVGLPELLGGTSSGLQSVVLRPGLAYRLPSPVFSQALSDSASLHALSMRYVQNLMLQMAQGVVCSLHHSVLQRLSSWLMYHHTVTASTQVRATHETIAHMLGVRRESITQAAGLLQQAGCISTSRGRIILHDSQALRGHVCECFAQIEQDHRQLWQVPLPEGGSLPNGRTHRLQDEASQSLTVEPPTPVNSPSESRYADIYDFAPVGLLSVDSQGQLIEANMAAAILLGIARSHCQEHRFVEFLQPESRQAFEQFHREVLSGRCRRHCELGLRPTPQRGHAVVRLDAVVDESGQESRMVMVDVTDSHRPSEAAQRRSVSVAAGAELADQAPTWWDGARTEAASARPGAHR